MANRYNEGIYSKGGVQQLALLKLLYNSTQPIDIGTLTHEMAMDRRSIYKCIEQLKAYMEVESLGTEIQVSAKGEYSYTGNKMDYYRLRGLIVDEEPMMHLAKQFLTKRTIMFDTFCAELFMSESTLKRYVGKANTLLKPLGIRISIKKNEIYLQGLEQSIRYCLVSFFWRAYHGVIWPFKNINAIHVHHTIDKLLRYSEHISYGKKKQFSYFLAVYILRAQAGLTVKKEELPSYFEALVYPNPIFERFSLKFTERFPLEKKELGFIYLSLFTFPDSYPYIQNTSETLEVLTTQGYKSYSSIKNFVAFIKEKYPEFDITAPEKKDFVAMLLASRIFIDIFDNIYFNSSALYIFSYAQK
ncbi:helix-turn-helix domain-containing protein, partial [Lactococcus petauri]|uniref:helix-turn-helix domain-containing protein n=1 Tax=Lactococcus petauri TaxID=1940789 RepID=UPI00385232BE